MPNINEQEIREYLLGSLSPERQAQIEFHIRSDADLSEELLAVEEELIDQYLAEDLSEVEQQLFETNFLTSTERHRRLDFGRVFKQYRDSYSPPIALTLDREETSASPRVPAPDIAPPMRVSSPVFPRFNRNPSFVVLLVVLAGLIIMATAWLFSTRPPAHVDIAATTPPLVVTLAPGSARSGDSISVSVPAKNDHVQLELQLANSNFKKYKTQLFRENQALESQDELKTEPRNAHYVVPVTVTGDILTPGDYQLKLSGVADSGQPEFIDSYSFRVITK
jgi:hypothetical protein